MEKEKPKKFTLRQKWFPTFDEAQGLHKERCKRKYMDYDSCKFPVRDLIGRWTRTLILAGSILYGSYQVTGNDIEYSKGTRTGMINKVSEKGLFWKTFEGEMALEWVVSGDTSVGANVWDFSIDRQRRHGENPEQLVRKLSQYLESGTKVKVDYIEQFATYPWRSETNYLIQNVEPINQAEKSN